MNGQGGVRCRGSSITIYADWGRYGDLAGLGLVGEGGLRVGFGFVL